MPAIRHAKVQVRDQRSATRSSRPADLVHVIERPNALWWRPQLRALAKLKSRFAASDRSGQKSHSILQ